MGVGQGAGTPGREFFDQESTPRCSGGLGLEDEGSSLPPWYGRQSGQDFLISTRLPEPRHRPQTSRTRPELSLEPGSLSWAPSPPCGPAGQRQSPEQRGLRSPGRGGRMSGQDWGLQESVCPLPCAPRRGCGLGTIKIPPFRNHPPQEDRLW